MPFFRLVSPALDKDQRSKMARELTRIAVDAFATTPDQCVVQFVGLDPEKMAIGGELLSESHRKSVHLVVSEPGITPPLREYLSQILQPLLLQQFGMGEDERSSLRIVFGEFEYGQSGNLAGNPSGQHAA